MDSPNAYDAAATAPCLFALPPTNGGEHSTRAPKVMRVREDGSIAQVHSEVSEEGGATEEEAESISPEPFEYRPSCRQVFLVVLQNLRRSSVPLLLIVRLGREDECSHRPASAVFILSPPEPCVLFNDFRTAARQRQDDRRFRYRQKVEQVPKNTGNETGTVTIRNRPSPAPEPARLRSDSPTECIDPDED
jgi:hypothetical protein